MRRSVALFIAILPMIVTSASGQECWGSFLGVKPQNDHPRGGGVVDVTWESWVDGNPAPSFQPGATAFFRHRPPHAPVSLVSPQVEVRSPTHARVTVPEYRFSPETFYPVFDLIIVNPDGSVQGCRPNGFVYVPLSATVTSLSPPVAPPGNLVTISGDNFVPQWSGNPVTPREDTVKVSLHYIKDNNVFGQRFFPLTDVRFVNFQTITGVIPAQPPIAADWVYNLDIEMYHGGGGRLQNAFRYVNAASSAPTLSGFAPMAGEVGLPVVITGEHFETGMSVHFGGIASASVQVIDRNAIIARVPAGAVGAHKITVITTGGSATSVQSFTHKSTDSKTWDEAKANAVSLGKIFAALLGSGRLSLAILPTWIIEWANQFSGGSVGVVALSPVDLVVTAPDGRQIRKSFSTFSEAVYLEGDFFGNGEVIDIILINDRELPREGYKISILPEPGAAPDSTFSLISYLDSTGRVVEHTLVTDAPVGTTETSIVDALKNRRRLVTRP